MKFAITATAQELAEKGEALVKAVIEELAPVRPDLAEVIEKALDLKPFTSNAQYPALTELEQHTYEAYQDQMKRMVADIIQVLEEPDTVTKSSHTIEAEQRVIARLVAAGETPDGLDRLTLPELLQKAANL